MRRHDARGLFVSCQHCGHSGLKKQKITNSAAIAAQVKLPRRHR
jgi:putative N-acetylmannosamine-6-phosphate epimerase